MYGKAYFDGDSDSHISTGLRFMLKAPCPVEGCPNSNNIITWKCDICGNYLLISDDGFLGCGGWRNCFYGRIDKCRFNCGEHDFRYPSYQGLYYMISYIGSSQGDKALLRNFFKAVENFKDN